MFQKATTYINPKYESFVRSKPCLCCGKEAVMHHESGLGIGLVGGGMGKKCSSLAGVPLCHECHDRRDHEGYVTFWLNYGGILSTTFHPRHAADGILMREIIKLLMEWIEK